MPLDQVEALLDLNGYGVFVWPAYVVAALVMLGLLIVTLVRLRRRRMQLIALQGGVERARPRPRPPANVTRIQAGTRP